jgi:hypothetical protein
MAADSLCPPFPVENALPPLTPRSSTPSEKRTIVALLTPRAPTPTSFVLPSAFNAYPVAPATYPLTLRRRCRLLGGCKDAAPPVAETEAAVAAAAAATGSSPATAKAEALPLGSWSGAETECLRLLRVDGTSSTPPTSVVLSWLPPAHSAPTTPGGSKRTGTTCSSLRPPLLP